MAKRTAIKTALPKSTAAGRGPGRTLWLVAAGLVAGVAGGVFAFRMLVPKATTAETSPTGQPGEILVREEPVEISTRMRPGEWTEESLQEHVENYRQQIRAMGAPDSQIVTNVERTEQGAARVVVSWDRN
ncbi:hypothetical protein LFT48_18215 [Arthrobacter sp. FW305-123]|nr:hypothetical protein LFT48_18215 [Arthrobacter sp. FW305-123]